MRRTISIIFLLLIGTFSFTFSQVVIKEKVELKLQSSKTTGNQLTRGYTPCGPYMQNTEPGHYWQVVWAGYHGSLDPKQQLFEQQGNVNISDNIGPYNIRIIDGANYCSFAKRVIIYEDGYPYITMKDTATTELDGISSSDLLGSGDYMNFDCVPSHDDQIYKIGYHYLDIGMDEATVVYSIHSISSGKTIYLHTLIVKQPFAFFDKETYLTFAEDAEISTEAEGVFCTSLDSSSWYKDYQCKGFWIYSQEGGFPNNVKFNISIPEGQEYGDLFYFDENDNKIEGKYFNNLDYYYYERLKYQATGLEPTDTVKVKIHISTTDVSIPGADSYVYVIPTDTYPIKVTLQPDSLSPGDTAKIKLEQMMPGYPITYEPFSNDQLFDVKIDAGSKYGTILNPIANDTADEFNNIKQGFKFIASKNIDTSEVKVSIRVHAMVNTGFIIMSTKKGDKGQVKGSKGINAQKNISLKKIAAPVKIQKEINKGNENNITESKGYSANPKVTSTSPNGIEDIIGIGKAKIEKSNDIMLGEMKYYGVKKNDKNNSLKIEEIKANIGEKPLFPNAGTGWSWIKDSTIWGNNPVSIDTGKNYSKRMGVYWEINKPVWKYNYYKQNGQDHFTEQNVGVLPIGMIRLIGRYWTKDSTYVITLKTKSKNGESASIKIKLIRPSKLLSNGQSPSFARTRDVQDSVLNIDSLCIYYGGINGVPPQYVKGHIYQESAKDNYTFSDGKTEQCFAPSYRYEPYTAQTWKDVLDGMKTNPFYITATTNVNPPNHQHIKVIPYFSGDTTTVWQIVAEHSQLLRDGSTDETRLYGVRTHSDTMNYKPSYTSIQNKYHEFFVETKSATIFDESVKKTRELTFAERADSTNKKMIVYLRDEFTDEIGTKGMKNMIAQTRIASSYGYFQPLYTTAINKNDKWKYPEDADNLPENLNKNSVIFPMATRMEKEYLENGLKDKSKNNWDIGFEGAFEKYIFKNWNKDKEYPISVMYNANKFLPQK